MIWRACTFIFALSTGVLALIIMVDSPSETSSPAAQQSKHSPTQAQTSQKRPAHHTAAQPNRAPSPDGRAIGSIPSTADERPLAWVDDPNLPLPPDIIERAREQIGEQWRKRRAERSEFVKEEILAFLEGEGSSESTLQTVQEILAKQDDEMAALRAQVQAGELTRWEARREFLNTREASRNDISKTLGAETAEALWEHLALEIAASAE